METMLLGNANQTYQQIKEIMAMVPFYSEELIANKLMALFSEEASAYIGVLNALSVPVFIKGFESGYLFVNQAYCELMKVRAADLIGKKAQDVYGWTAADNEIHLRMDIELLKTKKARIYESTVTNGRHESLRLRVKKDLVTTREGSLTVILGELTAVEQPEKAERQHETAMPKSRFSCLKKTQERFQSDVEALVPEQAYQRILTYAAELLGKPCTASYSQILKDDLVQVSDIGSPADRNADSSREYRQSIQWFLTRDNPNRIVRIDDYGDLSEIIPQSLAETSKANARSSLFVPIQLDGTVSAYLNFDSDKPKWFDDSDVELMEWFKLLLEKQLEMKALRTAVLSKVQNDPKTGLLNRSEFEYRLENIIQEAKTNRAEIYMVYCDLLGLSKVNLLGGWTLGDQVLKAYLDQVFGHLTSILFSGRLEGDKFAFVCSESIKTQIAELLKSAEQIYGKGICTEKGMLHVPLAIVLSPYESRFERGNDWQRAAQKLAASEKDNMRALRPFFTE